MIVEQPGPEPVVFAPIQARVQFTCSVTEGYTADWRVLLPDRTSSVDTDERNTLPLLNGRNITVDGLETSKSIISLDIFKPEENETNNQTSLACLAINRESMKFEGHKFQVIFYGMC